MAEIRALADKIHQRVQLVDNTLLKKQSVGGVEVDPARWEDRLLFNAAPSAYNPLHKMQEAMDASRKQLGEHGIWLRPALFWRDPSPPQTPRRLPQEPETESENSSPAAGMSHTDILYFKTTAAAKGVLQVHRAPGTAYNGQCS